MLHDWDKYNYAKSIWYAKGFLFVQSLKFNIVLRYADTAVFSCVDCFSC